MRNSNYIIKVLLVVLILLVPFKMAKAMENVNICIDGTIVGFDSLILNERIMIPYQELGEALNLYVKRDINEHEILISKRADSDAFFICSMQEGECEIILKDGQHIEIDTPVTEKNGVVYVPIRALCNVLGFSVEWNEFTRTASIDTQSFVNEKRCQCQIIEDKLRIDMPDDILISQDSDFIHPNTEFFIIRKDTSIRMFAEELYVKSNGDFKEDVNKLGYKNVREIHDFNNINIALVQFDHHKEQELTMAYIIRIDGGYLFRLTFCASTDSDNRMNDIIQLIKDSVNTISYGNTAIDLNAKTYSLGKLKIDLPEGYFAYTSYGFDFVLWHIQQIKEVGEPKKTLLIYWGNWPDYPGKEKETPVFRSSFLGEQLDWFVMDDNSIEALRRIKDDEYFHLIITAETEADIKELLDISQKVVQRK